MDRRTVPMQARATVLVTALAIAALVLPASASASPHYCGSYDGARWTYGQVQGAGILDVSSRNVTCRTARRVALHAYDSYPAPYTAKRWTFRDWRCRVLERRYEYSKTRCLTSRAMVRWEAGA